MTFKARELIEADFHIHSKFSRDSFLSPRQIIKTATKKGLSMLAVTDHDDVKGGLVTMQEASNLEDLVVIPGTEVKTDIGDVIGLFIEEKIKSRDFFNVVDEIKDQNGLVVLLHPFRGHDNIAREIMSSIDVVEALNGRSSSTENLKARQLASLFDKPIIAGSDAHFSFEIGCVRTILPGASTSFEELRKSITDDERKLIGRESPFIVHALSFGAEKLKRVIGRF